VARSVLSVTLFYDYKQVVVLFVEMGAYHHATATCTSEGNPIFSFGCCIVDFYLIQVSVCVHERKSLLDKSDSEIMSHTNTSLA
jgi:hypothetical protein